jgi:hypothetical protein
MRCFLFSQHYWLQIRVPAIWHGIFKNFDKPKTNMETQTTFGNHLVTGMFSDKESADNAYHALQTRGYNDSNIHLVMSDDTNQVLQE